MNHPKTAPHMQSLQLLRAIAALLVVFYHIESVHDDSPWATVYTTLFDRGHIGVDLFFVLSGFLVVLTRPKAGGVRSSSSFLVRRFLRIWPAYAIITLIYGIILTDSSTQQLVRSLLFLPQANDPPLVLGFPSLFVGWTLNYEAWFYISCAIIILFPARLFAWMLPAWAATCLLWLPSLYSVPVTQPPLETPASAYPVLYMALISNPIIWEFIAGAVLALVYERLPKTPLMKATTAKYLAVAGIALFAALYLILDNKMEPLACGIPALILVFTLVNLERTEPIRLPSFFVLSGNISYGIYLIHPIWLVLLRPQAERSATHEFGMILLVVSLTFVSATILHYAVERPAQSLARKWGHRIYTPAARIR